MRFRIVLMLFSLVSISQYRSGSSPPRQHQKPSAESITVYSGQHEQTVSVLVDDFRGAPGSRSSCARATRASWRTRSCRRARTRRRTSSTPRTRRPWRPSTSRSCWRPVDAARWRRSRGRTARRKGDWVGVSARTAVLVYNTGQLTAASCRLAAGPRPTRSGRAGSASPPTETDFQPLVTAVAKLKGEDAAKQWLAGLKANGKVYDGQRGDHRGGQQRRDRRRADRPLLLVPAARRARRGQDPLALHYFAPRRPGQPRRRLRRGACWRRATTRQPPSSSSPTW